MRWDVGRAARWGGSLMDCAVTSRSVIYDGGAADERGVVNRPAGGVFHTELAFMKNTRTALLTAPPGPPWRMEKDAWQASSLFVNLNCSRSLTPEGNFVERAGPAEGEGKEGSQRGAGEEGRGRTAWHSWRLFGSWYLVKWLVFSCEEYKSDWGLFGSQVEGGCGEWGAGRLRAHNYILHMDGS